MESFFSQVGLFFSSIGNLFIIILKGIGTLISFVVSLPILINSLLGVIPEPFNSIISSFIGVIILLIIIYFAGRIMAAILGG